MSKPLISIVMPTYNRAHTIQNSINSILDQTYTNWELLIIDDGSIDNTKEIIQPFLKDKRIQYDYQENQGECIARNEGMKKSKGEYIAFLDSDDKFLPKKLEIQLNEMIKNNALFSLTDKIICKNNKKIKPQKEYKITSRFASREEIIGVKIKPYPTVSLLKKGLYLQGIRFNSDLHASTDHDFLLQAMCKTDILYIPVPLSIIYKTLGYERISTNYNRKINSLKTRVEHTEKNIHNLNKEEQQIEFRQLFANIGFFLVLNEKYNEGREYLKKYFKISKFNLRYIKYKIIYYLSYNKTLIKLAIKLGKKLWEIGIIS